ncbi:hypothetical protein A359_04190 [secondary endosymbiont of Ctenarytaina eucalypti]|uniref:Uncharacterized protein n=1 Tax=secondary endosymbiont of Ctenarytaina eucalypti TaxID=1199245 RepID=J3TF94_9ENTR|nr:hypothetical protein A359_04190 [secondary endosymbiont of Ctenarytaina eucalypti]
MLYEMFLNFPLRSINEMLNLAHFQHAPVYKAATSVRRLG